MGNTLLDNRILLASFLAWAAAQISKTIYELIRQRKFVIGPLVSSGGMP
ncbi:MAG: divergent PAP2 family protein, partial [Chloroflexi bacterium]